MDKELFKKLLFDLIEKERWCYELENNCICGCCSSEYSYVNEYDIGILVDCVFVQLESSEVNNG